MSGPLGDLHSARVLAARAAEAVAKAEGRCVRSSADAAIAFDARDEAGQRLYVLLALFDRRDGSALADLVQTAREGWERSHPDMDEADAWREFDAIWSSFTSSERLDLRFGEDATCDEAA